MASHCEFTIGNLCFRLLAERGVYWPEHDTLFVADPHLGKDASFRRGGIPIPHGSSKGTLRVIANMLADTAASHLVILGDMFHTLSSLSSDVHRCMQLFLADHPNLLITLVRGNHDSHVGKLPSDWPVDTIEPGKLIDGVMLSHDPSDDVGEATMMLCGHVHPAVSYHGGLDAVRRVPCFTLSNRRLILPAVGKFTGTHLIQPRPDDKVWIVAEHQVVELPLRLRARDVGRA